MNFPGDPRAGYRAWLDNFTSSQPPPALDRVLREGKETDENLTCLLEPLLIVVLILRWAWIVMMRMRHVRLATRRPSSIELQADEFFQPIHGSVLPFPEQILPHIVDSQHAITGKVALKVIQELFHRYRKINTGIIEKTGIYFLFPRRNMLHVIHLMKNVKEHIAHGGGSDAIEAQEGLALLLDGLPA